MRFSLFFLLVFINLTGFAQSVVVSEYFNQSSNATEWTELLILQDNLDLRGFAILDNNMDQDNWQTPCVFSNSPLWNNLRTGTIILLWHDNSSSSIILDTDKQDGYLELSIKSTGYFTGGTGTSLNIAQNGDLIQIRNSSGTHVHLLGHKSTPGVDFTNANTPKLNHSQSIGNGESVRVDPGANLMSYGGGSGTTSTSKGTTGITFGLPNSTSNLAYWRSIRQPLFPSNTLNAVTSNAAFTQFYLSWNACTDPYPADSTTGYLILRNITNSFSDPQDGTNYTAGQSIGSATVVASIVGSNRITFTDNTNLACGQTFFYKVYAYRFNADNQSNSSTARGRAYNETGTNVQSISRPYPSSSLIAY